MWEDLVYTKTQAKLKFQQIEAQPENCAPRKVKPAFEQLRQAVLTARDDFAQNATKKTTPYEIDLHIALMLYELLNTQYQFNERLAARDEIWRYIALEIIPDVVYERCGLSEDRFYKRAGRIWPKALWWYIHLSWQGTAEQTKAILVGNTSDDILQLIDRSGTGGYRIELTRELMRQHHFVENKPSGIFRRILKLNTARSSMVEPSLVEGGVEAYVADLYHYFQLKILVKS